MVATVRKVGRINFHDLLMFTSGRGAETESVMQASTVLAVLIRHVPSMLFTPVGANFFTPEGRKPITGGLEVWRGYHQSVRSMMAGHLGINIDVASTVFRKAIQIGKISRESARDFNFENKEGGQMSVETYFKDHLKCESAFSNDASCRQEQWSDCIPP
ncbi:hypothetical protein BASA81_010516 [Batrachochytrium salamandrivorans]|nr:hypothetical protein BASA81_010516 [Batrachochytrium salamandrivorans]